MRINAPMAGFALFLLTDIVSFHATTAFATFEHFDDTLQGIYFMALVASRIITYAIVAFALKGSRRSSLPPAPTAAIATLTSLAGITLMVFFLTTGNVHSVAGTVVFGAGAVLFGAAQGFMSLVWLSTLATFSYRGSYLYLIASHGGATVLCAVTLTLPSSWLLPLMVVTLTAANLCALRLSPQEPKPYTLSQSLIGVAPLLWKGVLAVSVFAFVSGFVTSIARLGSVQTNPIDLQFFVLGVSSVVLIVMTTPALAFHQPLKLESGYRVALPLSALGFLVLPGLIDSIPPSVAGTLATTGYMLTGIVLYCTLAEMAKAADTPSLPLLAVSDCITLVALLGGTILGSLAAPRLASTSTGIALVGLGSLYLVALAASWLVGRTGSAKKSVKVHTGSPKRTISALVGISKSTINAHTDTSGSTAEGGRANHTHHIKKSATSRVAEYTPTPASSPATTAHAIVQPAQTCINANALDDLTVLDNLTEQQREICSMLMEGHTMKRIAQEQYLSESAVKYHAQKIYQRFGVHTRTELSELMRHTYRTQPPEASGADDLAKNFDLTARERDILFHLARGLSVVETAHELGISENTVKTHSKRVYGKLGVHSKQEVIDLLALHDQN